MESRCLFECPFSFTVLLIDDKVTSSLKEVCLCVQNPKKILMQKKKSLTNTVIPRPMWACTLQKLVVYAWWNCPSKTLQNSGHYSFGEKSKVARNEKKVKTTWGFCIPKIWQIWSVLQGNFIQHKPLISEECMYT